MSYPSFTKTSHKDIYEEIDPTNPSLSAKGKVVIVTGGSKGIGRAIAIAYARAQAEVVIITGRTESTLSKTVEEIQKANTLSVTTAKYYVVDVQDNDKVFALFADVKKNFGSLDIVVGNAGYLSDIENIENSKVDDWWKGFEINVKGAFIVLQAFLKNASDGATFISISSGVVHAPYIKGVSAYSSSKIAFVKIIEEAHAEYEQFRFFSIHPGMIETDMSAKFGASGVETAELPAGFCLWLGTAEADFLRGRFTWATWDVKELKAMEEEIMEKNLLHSSIKGWHFLD